MIMIEQFKDDFYFMLKHSIGYLPWIKKYPYRLDRVIYGENDHCCRHKESHNRQLVRKIIEERVCENEMIDIFYKSIIRSEIRFSYRFIPQGSHEERLTGHLISEIGASIEIIKKHFEKASVQAYGEKKNIDFFYFDMSKGGKLEKNTGADLAISIIVDLPDYPKMIKSFIFQAKKYSHNAQIDLPQYEILNNHYGKSKGYLFYDTNIFTLSSPFVLETDDYTMEECYKGAINNNNKSFSLSENDIFDGLPLSAFLCFNLLSNENIGNKHRDLSELISYFNNFHMYHDKPLKEVEDNFHGYLGIVSIGKKLNYQPNSTNEGYGLTLE
jgi:hypothetical protein